MDSFAYFPPNFDHLIESDTPATIVVFERRFVIFTSPLAIFMFHLHRLAIIRIRAFNYDYYAENSSMDFIFQDSSISSYNINWYRMHIFFFVHSNSEL